MTFENISDYFKKFDLMFQLMIVNNSYILNYYTLEHELVYERKNIDPTKDESLNNALQLQLSRRFYFHAKLSNFLNSVQNTFDITRQIIKKLDCHELNEIRQTAINSLEAKIVIVKDLRNIYTHSKLLPVNFMVTTTFSGQADEKYHLVLSKEFLLKQNNLNSASKIYLNSLKKDYVDLLNTSLTQCHLNRYYCATSNRYCCATRVAIYKPQKTSPIFIKKIELVFHLLSV